MKIEELKSKLEKLAAKKILFDEEDYNARDASGGNFDDAYQLGMNDGEVLLARDILGWLAKE